VFDRLIAIMSISRSAARDRKIAAGEKCGSWPPRDQRGTTIGIRRRLLRRYNSTGNTSTRTGESPNRVVLSVVGIVPAEIAVVLVLILILILVS
jgi:hypothetical protein